VMMVTQRTTTDAQAYAMLKRDIPVQEEVLVLLIFALKYVAMAKLWDTMDVMTEIQ
jgi:hypothetical protein